MTEKNYGSPAKHPHRRRAACTVLAVLLACFAGISCLDRAFGPVIREFAQLQARYLAVTAISRAVQQEMEQHPQARQNLSRITHNAEGRITSVELDSASANRLSVRLTQAANGALNRMKRQPVKIPLGTVLGWQFLMGRGPLVTFYIQPASYAQASFQSTLEGAGYNQSLHNVVLRVSVVMETFSAGFHTEQTVDTEMLLSQTVIVGSVPDLYGYNN